MATPVRTPQNANNVLILLAAIDANLGKYLTVEKQNRFLDELVQKYDFEWEGKGKWGDSHETLRRVLNRLAQDRRPEFRDLTGDDKLHDRVHALFRHGSEILSEERLRAYGYNQTSTRSLIDGKRKRVETEAGREYRRVSNAGRRRRGDSRDGNESDAYPAQKRLRTSGGETERNTRSSNGTRHADTRRMSLQEDLPRIRRYGAGRKASSVEANGARREVRSSPQRYADDSDNGEGSSEYEDAMPHFVERTRVERKASPPRQTYSTRRGATQYQNVNGRHNHNREPSPNPWQINGATDSWANGASFQVAEPPSQQNLTHPELTLSDRLASLHQKIAQLASFFYPPSTSTSILPTAPVIHATPSPSLAALYASIFGSSTTDWHRIAGPLLEHRALPAKSFLIALTWSFLRQKFLDTDATGFHQAPLWSLLDEKNLTHRWARGYYQSGVQAASATSSTNPTANGEDEAGAADAAWPLMRSFFRKVAYTQLHEDRRFMRNFLGPTSWDSAFELHGLLNLHSTVSRPNEGSAASAAFYSSAEKYSANNNNSSFNKNIIPESQHTATTTTGNLEGESISVLRPSSSALNSHPDLPLLCKEICLEALLLRASVQICTEKYEWIWVESGAEWEGGSAATSGDGAATSTATRGDATAAGNVDGSITMAAFDAAGLTPISSPPTGSRREDLYEEEVAVGLAPGLKWIPPSLSEEEMEGMAAAGAAGTGIGMGVGGRGKDREQGSWEVERARVLLMPL